ncbi:hypothetical protein [Sphingobium cupriresistens]|uniref:Uncharacterized protein n=1 Tax=Sphingobium cupriresistens TaxID=1132417 RepID=A0A8G1ZES4_9SPHN|nr:hypothetical protein [Sphingobium cupriresistens]RYM09633.1 hypothetical protein EWH12_13665 [Sphingobium cupriresistens]
MTLKQPIEIRSVKTGRFVVHTAIVSDAVTADFCNAPRSFRVVNNVIKAMTISHDGVDIRNINRLLREPQEPAAELTTVDALATTR